MEMDHAPQQRPLNERHRHGDTERYVREKLIGAGTYGEVYRAIDRQQNRVVALKEIRLDAEEVGMPSTALREIALLRGLDHANIIKYGLSLTNAAQCRAGRISWQSASGSLQCAALQ